jgi:hypothetical protein
LVIVEPEELDAVQRLAVKSGRVAAMLVSDADELLLSADDDWCCDETLFGELVVDTLPTLRTRVVLAIVKGEIVPLPCAETR